MHQRTVYIGMLEYMVTADRNDAGKWIAHVDFVDHSSHPRTGAASDIQIAFPSPEEALETGVRVCKQMAKRHEANKQN